MLMLIFHRSPSPQLLMFLNVNESQYAVDYYAMNSIEVITHLSEQLYRRRIFEMRGKYHQHPSPMCIP